MKRFIFFLFILTASITAYTQSISGSIDWESLEIRSTVSLELASAGLKLPTGRTLAEYTIKERYTELVRSAILNLQVDSSSVIADLIERGEVSLQDIDLLTINTQTLPPSLSHDMLSMSASYSIPVTLVNAVLQKHNRPSPVTRILNPVSAANYTGIVIIASEKLPAHGMRSSFLPVPCLFPKIWDSDMNLIFDRKMTEPGLLMTRYSAQKNIFYNSPSGLSPELQEIVGTRPLRIFARGVFGIQPTDLIIDRADALLIISSENNRNLLTQGKVVIIVDESVLTQEF